MTAVRRAAAFARREGEGASLTLLNVQEVRQEAEREAEQAREIGRGLIATVAGKAGLEGGNYRTRVALGEDVLGTLGAEIEAFDLVCVGATRSTALTRALFGSIPERIGEEARATVAIVRGPREEPRTVVEALVEHLTGG